MALQFSFVAGLLGSNPKIIRVRMYDRNAKLERLHLFFFLMKYELCSAHDYLLREVVVVVGD